MIKLAGEQLVRVRENVRGGEGTLVFHDFLLSEESFGAGKLFSRTVIPAGEPSVAVMAKLSMELRKARMTPLTIAGRTVRKLMFRSVSFIR